MKLQIKFCIHSLKSIHHVYAQLREYIMNDCIIWIHQKTTLLLFNIEEILRNSITITRKWNWNQLCSFSVAQNETRTLWSHSKNWNPYNEKRRKIYREKEAHIRNMILTCVMLKLLILMLLKLISSFILINTLVECLKYIF